MYVTMNRIPVNDAYIDEFEQRFRDRVAAVDNEPGFVRNLVLRPADDSSEYHIVMTLWQSRQDFEAWTHSDSFKKAHEKARETPREMYAGRNVLEMFDVVCDSDQSNSA